MPITKIKVRLVSVQVLDDADSGWGVGEWHLHASVDGVRFGDPDRVFEVRSGDSIAPPGALWSAVVDVSGKNPGDVVTVRLRVIEEDVFSDDDLGEVVWRIRMPLTQPLQNVELSGPMLPGGWFSDDYRAYRAHMRVTIEEEFASTNTTGPDAVPIRRNAAGNARDFSTIGGSVFTPRVEVCPVLPVPAIPAHMPPRPALPAGLLAGVVPPTAQVTTAPSAPQFNALHNPCVIPILSSSDPELETKCARLTVTYYEPGNLDVSKLHWRIVSGPAEFVGARTGLSVKVRGTGNGSDTLAQFEVRWESDTGPLLAVYRAWVGKLGTLRYRVNMLNGLAGQWQVTSLMNGGQAHAIMQVVSAIVYQAGILLLPDSDKTTYNGASLFPPNNNEGIFQVTVTSNRHTRNVNHNVVSSSNRYNFRPGVINFAFVHSTLGDIAAAVDRNGIAGTASTAVWANGKLWYGGGGSGSTKNLDGSPSASWIKPSGVPGDAAGVKITLKTIDPTDRVKQASSLDKSYVAARHAASPPFVAADMGRLYAAQCPAVWGLGLLNSGTWNLAQYTWNCGINIAHELGHVLGLAHRGSGWSPTAPLSADGMDCPNQTGVMRGHPWNENIMTYGYATPTPLAHNIDLVQATVVRAHPAIVY